MKARFVCVDSPGDPAIKGRASGRGHPGAAGNTGKETPAMADLIDIVFDSEAKAE